MRYASFTGCVLCAVQWITDMNISTSNTVLSAQGLVKRFGGITATNNVTLNLQKGARHALIGPNGAGKTTLINLLTGGADGLQGVMMGPVLGQFEFDLYGRTAAWYSLTVLLVFFLLARRIVQSPFGATLKAIRDNRLRAMAIGIPVTAKLAQVYTLAAALAGAAGALLTQTTGFASLDLFEFHRSADVMLILVIGGVGWLYGGILGAIGFKLLQDVISSITPQYWTFWVGLFLVVLVLVGRDRLFRPWTWFRK